RSAPRSLRRLPRGGSGSSERGGGFPGGAARARGGRVRVPGGRAALALRGRPGGRRRRGNRRDAPGGLPPLRGRRGRPADLPRAAGGRRGERGARREMVGTGAHLAGGLITPPAAAWPGRGGSGGRRAVRLSPRGLAGAWGAAAGA